MKPNRQDWNGMFGRTSITRRQAESERDMHLSTVALANRTECGTMTLDSFGRIHGCCAAVEQIFEANWDNLVGRRVSDLIAGLCRGGSSPSYAARYLVYLSADSEWQRFEATDTAGRLFAVELKLIRRQVSGREMFVLSLRRPEKKICP